jgi:hypothetical protein
MPRVGMYIGPQSYVCSSSSSRFPALVLTAYIVVEEGRQKLIAWPKMI